MKTTIDLTPADCYNYTTTPPAVPVLLLNTAAPVDQKLGLAISLCHRTRLLASMASCASYADEQDLKAALSSVDNALEQVLTILHDAAKGTTQPSKVED